MLDNQEFPANYAASDAQMLEESALLHGVLDDILASSVRRLLEARGNKDVFSAHAYAAAAFQIREQINGMIQQTIVMGRE